MKTLRKISLFTAVNILVFSMLSTLVPTTKVSALSGSDFNASRIMDDFVFYSPNPTMTPDEIQRFLNAKVPTCDTNGAQIQSGSTTRAAYSASKGYPAPYTCLKDYTENTPARSGETGLCAGFNGGPLSAALIIYRVADSCGVSAKVILVMLQKEQSLITDDWPWPTQYRSAMGYGCPDTAPCDAQYYGFFNQVYQAARQLKRYAASPNLFNYAVGRNSYIQYQANAPQCGGSNLTPQTAATAALYNYTPYQPNPAALNNLYGSGDACSAYGNRNFWRLYRDWFGVTYAFDTDIPHPNGTLISGNGRVYLIDNNQKKHIKTPNIFTSYGYKWNRVKAATTGDLALPDGPTIDNLAPGTVFSSQNTPVYVMNINEGMLKKQHLSLNAFNSLGYRWDQVMSIPPNEVPSLTISGILETSLHPSGTVVSSQSEGKVYTIDNGTRRWVQGPTAFASNNLQWNYVRTATSQDMALPIGAPLGVAPGTIVNANGIFVINYDNAGPFYQPVGPWECYADRLHYTPEDWYYVLISSLPARSSGLFTC